MRSGSWRLASALLIAALPAVASAHQVGVSRGTYVADGATVRAEITLARPEILALAPGVDGGDGRLDEADLPAVRPVAASLLAGIEARSEGRPCPGELSDVTLTENDGLQLTAAFHCERAPGELALAFPMLARLSPGHRHLGHVVAGGTDATFVVHPGDARFTTTLAHRQSSFAQMFAMGVEHILTGYDHLVFLLGLVLVGGRLRSLLGVITAFTVAHSITLGIAATGIWAPSPTYVEPAIALSIAYVGVENFFVRDASKRWRITFPFGLIHGFGFAGALAGVGLPPGGVAPALLAFNLGVEAGQLAVLALTLPLLGLARRQSWFAQRGVATASALVTVAGVAWFVQRVI